MTSTEFVVSYEDETEIRSQTDELTMQSLLTTSGLKLCTVIPVTNSDKVTEMSLTSKERRNYISSFIAKVSERTYVHHSSIYLLYVPSILPTSSGMMTLKICNKATGEVVGIHSDFDATTACLFAGRYPRSINVSDVKAGKDLKLLISATASTNFGSRIGTIYPIWEDSLSKLKCFEECRPFLMFPIRETAPLTSIMDSKKLVNFVIQRVAIGNASEDSVPVVLEPPKPQVYKAKMPTFMRSASLRAPIKPGTSSSSESAGLKMAEGEVRGKNFHSPFESFVGNDDKLNA